jgi:hypothetical protein
LVILETGINLGGNYNFPALAYMDLHVQQFTAQLSQSLLYLPSNPREKDDGIGERAGSYFCPYLWGGRRLCLASGEGSYHSPTLSCSGKEVCIASTLSSTGRNYPHY